MKTGGFLVLAIIVAVVLFLVPASAHVPGIIDEGEGLENAVYVNDPIKSWAFYNQFESFDSVLYYKFDLKPGDRLWFSVFTPGLYGVIPEAVLTGPGIKISGKLPDAVIIPENSGYIVVDGIVPEKPGYEPFTPSANYGWFEYEYIAENPGIYYIALLNKGTSPGSIGFALGYREQFSLTEWISIPLSKVQISIWEGYSPVFVILFPIAVVLAGFFLLIRYHRDIDIKRADKITGITGGLLFIAGSIFTAFMTVSALIKTGFSVSFIVTVFFILIPAILGFFALKISVMTDEKQYAEDGIKMLIIGILGLIFWAGYITGALLIIISGVLMLYSLKLKRKETKN